MAENISAPRSARLDGLAKQRFTPEDKAERVSRALTALYSEEESIKLSPADWKWVAEEVDFEDQS
jgi:hypothetical protein